MNKVMITNLALFAAGAIVGSAVTWKVIKTKYEQIANEEIESVKEVYSRRYAEDSVQDEPEEDILEEDDEEDEGDDKYIEIEDPSYLRDDYVEELKLKQEEIISNERYDNKEEENMEYNVPQVISPEEFGEIEEYETVSLTYYADDVLTDESDIPIQEEDIDDMIGYESLITFGRYEDDSVFVRNDEYETYYEILLDTRNFADL